MKYYSVQPAGAMNDNHHHDPLPYPLRQQYKAKPVAIPLLPASTWQSWLADEVRQDTDRPTLASLFTIARDQAPTFDIHLAHSTYLLRSVSEYLEVYAEDPEAADQELKPVPEWPQGCIDAVSASVSMHGGHFTRGSELWEVLLQMHLLAGSDHESVRDVYLQWLSVPSNALDTVMHKYQRFEASTLSSTTSPAQTTTVDADNAPTAPTAAEIYESRIASATELYRTSQSLAYQYVTEYEPAFTSSPLNLPLLQSYLHTLAATLPSTLAVQGFLERIIAEAGSSDPAAWTMYVGWAKANLAHAQAVRVNDRALLACPAAGALWVHRVRLTQSFNEVVECVLGATNASVPEMEPVVAEAAAWAVRVSASAADALELVASYTSTTAVDETAVAPSMFVLEPVRVRLALLSGNQAEVDEVVRRMREVPCTLARPWIRVLRMLADARHVGVDELWQTAADRVVDDPRSLALERVEWADVHASSASEVEVAKSRLDAIDAWYAATAAAAGASAPVPNGSDEVPTDVDQMELDDQPKRAKRSRPDAGTRADDRHTARAHEKKKPKLDPELEARQAANDLARRNRTIVIKHVLPSYESAMRGVLEPIGGPILALRFLPTTSEGDKTQAFAEFATHEGLLEVFRYRRQLKLPGGGGQEGKSLVFAMAKDATVDPEAELAALAEAKRAEIAKEKDRLHAEQKGLDASGANLYVANLGKAVGPEELESVFNATVAEALGAAVAEDAIDGEAPPAAATAGVKEVTIMVTKFGESKGFGYVLMTSPEAARAVIDRWDGQKLPGHESEGRPLKVAVSDPNKSKNKQAAATSDTPDGGAAASAVRGSRVRDYDPCTVMIRNLNFATTESTIRTLLAAHGELASLRIPRDPKGRPRGMAFATFATPDQAQAAVHALDGLTCDERQLAASIPEPTMAATDSQHAKQLLADQRAKRNQAVEAEVRGKQAAAQRREMQPAMRDAERAARRVVVHGVPKEAQVDWVGIVFGGQQQQQREVVDVDMTGNGGEQAQAQVQPESRLTKEHVRDDGSRVLMFKTQADASRAVLRLDNAELPLGDAGEMVRLKAIESKPFAAPGAGGLGFAAGPTGSAGGAGRGGRGVGSHRGRGGPPRGRGGGGGGFGGPRGGAGRGRGGRGGRLGVGAAGSGSSSAPPKIDAMDVDPSK